MLRRRATVHRIPAPHGRISAPHGRIGDDEVHADVVVLDGQVVEDEPLGADPDADGARQLGQETVVEAAATSQAGTRRTERDTGDDDDVDRGLGGSQRRTGRFAHPERTDDELPARRMLDRHQPVTLDPREQDLCPRCDHVDQGRDIDLVRVRGVEEDRGGLTDLDEVEELSDDARRCGAHLAGRHVTAPREQRTSPVTFPACARGGSGPRRSGPCVGVTGRTVGRHARSVGPTARTAPDLPRRPGGAQYAPSAVFRGPRGLAARCSAIRPVGGGITVVRTAVIPVAGLGTRFLPATKAVPKEMLPIVDRPAIQYIVEEVARSGIDDVLLVTALGKPSIEDHFDRRIDLEVALEEKGRDAELAEIRALADLVTVHAVRQPEPLGLGHAVLMAAGHVAADESFAVLLGDDLLEPDSTFLARMVAAHERTGVAVVALLRVEDPEQLALYGVVDAVPGEHEGEVLIRDLVEKPAPGTAPSDLAVIGRYVLPGSIFEVLRTTEPGRGGEIQLTDALRSLAADTPIVGIVIDEPRHDAGDKLGFLTATLAFAARRPDLGPDLIEWLQANLPDLEQRAAAAAGDDDDGGDRAEDRADSGDVA